MGAGYTELFFFDGATALAAGHRPCFECRRKGVRRSVAAGRGSASAAAPPDGAFVSDGGDAFLLAGGKWLLWTAEGYRASAAKGPLFLLTPPSTVAAIAAGYAPRIGRRRRRGGAADRA
jgi:hypothetical protein